MTSPPGILVIDDDEVDVMNVRRALNQLGVKGRLEVASDGVDALEALNRLPPKAQPRLVLLDLNMPRMNGIEFLRTIRQSENLKRLHVIVLTTSDDPEDIRRAYEYNAAGYVLKPLDYQNFVQAMETITDFWHLIEAPRSKSG